MAQILDLAVEDLDKAAREGIPFAALPPAASQAKNYTGWSRDFEDWFYRTQSLDLYEAPLVKEVSLPEETEGDFRIRIRLKTRELKDAETESLRKKYAAKVTSLESVSVRRSRQSIAKRIRPNTEDANRISFGATLLSSFLGKKKVSASSVGKATTAIRGASRALKESGDVERSKETVEALNAQLENLRKIFGPIPNRLRNAMIRICNPGDRFIASSQAEHPGPRNDLAWLPCRVDAGGIETPAWE